MLKINLKKIKKNYFNIFLNKKHYKKQQPVVGFKERPAFSG
jgi:hypothetical protein